MKGLISKLKNYVRKLLIANPTKANYKFVLKNWTQLPDLEAMARVLDTKRFTQNLEPVIMNCPNAQTILVISPHPDDDVLSSGGVLLKCIKNGVNIKVIYITSGTDSNTRDSDRRILEDETVTVAQRLQTNIEFWRYDKKSIPLDGTISQKFKDAVKTFQPDVVFVPFLADDHVDHRRCSQLFYEALKDERCLSFEVWAYQVYSTVLPNIVIDITDVIDKKMELINIWESQKKSRDWAHYIRGLNAFNCRFLKTNQARYAETFFVVPAQEYIKLCKKYFD